MKIATFNVNGIKTRLPNLLQWLEREQPDVACLQELKALDDSFPQAELRKIGCERPLMDEIEKRFAGMDVQEVPDGPTQNAPDPTKILIQASDLRSGEILEQGDMLDEALVVYRRCLAACHEKIAKFGEGGFNTGFNFARGGRAGGCN